AWLEAMSPQTRALYDAYKAAEAEDEAAGHAHWVAGALEDIEESHAPKEQDEADRLANPEPPEDWNAHRRKPAPPQEDWPKVGPRVRRLKGEWG
ncbi:MAG: hypothetical protein WA842_05305, partial [Croceibacterium sp.]